MIQIGVWTLFLCVTFSVAVAFSVGYFIGWCIGSTSWKAAAMAWKSTALSTLEEIEKANDRAERCLATSKDAVELASQLAASKPLDYKDRPGGFGL